ncbi:AMP-binding protein [Pseudomonas corrugata]
MIIDHETLLSPTQFAQALTDAEVSVLFVTTAMFNQYLVLIPDALAGLRILLCGGERGDPASFRRLLAHAPSLRLVHCYGPTETTTFATTHVVTAVPHGATSVPIGRPIANTRVYILDAARQPVPVGVAGEIHIGGVGVALGYLNRPDLTEERFIVDPFSDSGTARLYRSGDLGRWLPDGTIEYLDRNDGQVKIRGFRIELGEIEARLHECHGVREALVVAREDSPGDKRLIAYYTEHENAGGLDADVPARPTALRAAGIHDPGRLCEIDGVAADAERQGQHRGVAGTGTARLWEPGLRGAARRSGSHAGRLVGRRPEAGAGRSSRQLL